MHPATATSKLQVVFQPSPRGIASPALANSLSPLLELTLAQAHVEGIYVYRFLREEAHLHLAVWSGLEPTGIVHYQVQVSGQAAAWYCELASPTILDRAAWRDFRFQDLPEFLHHRFEGVASIPLLDGGELVGIANCCRRQAGAFTPVESAFLRSLCLPLGSLLTASWTRNRLQSELEKVSQQLADRKVLERAKGLLQARNQWSEEEAYLHLRNTSRRRRTPLRQIAREIIEGPGATATRAANAAN